MENDSLKLNAKYKRGNCRSIFLFYERQTHQDFSCLYQKVTTSAGYWTQTNKRFNIDNLRKAGDICLSL